ncbi:hypothetical protein SAMN05444380_1253 [Thermophagus xiamenensis]|uniref:Uncharacterized protein n=1 Tax=Thermophagus xiamenensis TaxID=385682 RepID=A0A1I2EX41_9BACT|nr:hypothetical protein SAMN05444380_1253 [Thermophagus xiamenensis]
MTAYKRQYINEISKFYTDETNDHEKYQLFRHVPLYYLKGQT